MKTIGILALFFSLISCTQKEKINHSSKIEKTKNVTESFIKDTLNENLDFLDIENITINNINILLPKNKFDSIVTNPDSVTTRNCECVNPFEWLDEKWMISKYGEKVNGSFVNYDGEISNVFFNDICYISNNHLALFESLNVKNNFVKIKVNKKHIKLNNSTSIKNFKSFFPNLDFETTKNLNEIRFRVLINKNELDAFLFYFKNGKFNKLELWWDLC